MNTVTVRKKHRSQRQVTATYPCQHLNIQTKKLGKIVIMDLFSSPDVKYE